jgi:hypothetical protein
MIRVLTRYSKRTEALLDELTLPDINLEELEQLFGPSPDDRWFVLCYAVSDAQRPFIEQVTGARLDFKRFVYFVETYATSPRETVTQPDGAVWYLPPRDLPAFPTARRVRPKS